MVMLNASLPAGTDGAAMAARVSQAAVVIVKVRMRYAA